MAVSTAVNVAYAQSINPHLPPNMDPTRLQAVTAAVALPLRPMERRLDQRMRRMENGMARMSVRMAHMEGHMIRMDRRMACLERRMADMERRMTRIEQRVTTTETNIIAIKSPNAVVSLYG